MAAIVAFRPRTTWGGVLRRQIWIALLMGLIAAAAIQGLWSSSDPPPRASRPTGPLRTTESAGAPTVPFL